MSDENRARTLPADRGPGAQKILDDLRRKLIEWRKTFAPEPENEVFGTLTTPVLLDELYCRDLLRAVPEIVDRTRQLSHLTLLGIDPQAFVYLREAANCYILGLPQAAVALARSAIEVPLPASAAKLFGEETAALADLKQLIDDYAKRGSLLPPDARASAHRVRIAANEVLHQRPIESADALAVVEAARAVILALGRRDGSSNAPARAAPGLQDRIAVQATAPNAVERTAGSHSFAAAAHRRRSDNRESTREEHRCEFL